MSLPFLAEFCTFAALPAQEPFVASRAASCGAERAFALDAEGFAALFPFHIVLDRRMRIIQACIGSI